jgi:hypothetical protein
MAAREINAAGKAVGRQSGDARQEHFVTFNVLA